MKTPLQTPVRASLSASSLSKQPRPPPGYDKDKSWFSTIIQGIVIFFSVVWLLAVIKVFLLDDGGVQVQPAVLSGSAGAGAISSLAAHRGAARTVTRAKSSIKAPDKRTRPVILLPPTGPVVLEDLAASKKVYVRHADAPRGKHSKGTLELPLSSEWELIRTNPNYHVGQNPNYKSEMTALDRGAAAVQAQAQQAPLAAAAKTKALGGLPLRNGQPGAAISNKRALAYELQWPPVQADGLVAAHEGTEKMPVTGLDVPRFWEAPPGTDLNTVGTKVNGFETIFLMIASYRDFQCRETITSAYKKADHPERLYVAAVDQLVDGDIGCLDIDIPCSQDPTQMICVYRSQISVFKMDATQATGPVTARHIGDRLYRGQYFVMQMDAHCLFVRHWDTNIVSQWRQTGNEMAVLSSYLTDVQGSIDAKGDSLRDTRPIMCNSDFEGAMPARYLRHGSQPEDVPTVREMPQLQPFWAAGFSFSRGHFKLRVPYDAYQPMVFQVHPAAASCLPTCANPLLLTLPSPITFAFTLAHSLNLSLILALAQSAGGGDRHRHKGLHLRLRLLCAARLGGVP